MEQGLNQLIWDWTENVTRKTIQFLADAETPAEMTVFHGADTLPRFLFEGLRLEFTPIALLECPLEPGIEIRCKAAKLRDRDLRLPGDGVEDSVSFACQDEVPVNARPEAVADSISSIIAGRLRVWEACLDALRADDRPQAVFKLILGRIHQQLSQVYDVSGKGDFIRIVMRAKDPCDDLVFSLALHQDELNSAWLHNHPGLRAALLEGMGSKRRCGDIYDALSAGDLDYLEDDRHDPRTV